MSHKSFSTLIEVVPPIDRSPQLLLQIAQLRMGRPAANQILHPLDNAVKTHTWCSVDCCCCWFAQTAPLGVCDVVVCKHKSSFSEICSKRRHKCALASPSFSWKCNLFKACLSWQVEEEHIVISSSSLGE